MIEPEKPHENKSSLEEHKSSNVSIRGRLIVGLHMLLCWAFIHAQRSSFNVIIAQVVSINPKEKRMFMWTQMKKTTALMSFYAGYLMLQVVYGTFAEKYGSKHFMSAAGLISSLISIATPFAIERSANLTVAIRVVLGFVQAVIPPCFLIMLANWFPESCRSRAISLIIPGIDIGSILAMKKPRPSPPS